MHLARRIAPLSLALATSAASACDESSVALFSCEASNGRKFIELCSPSPAAADGFLEYRFGSLDGQGRERAAELVFPGRREGSMSRFYGATYTHEGVYTQSVRFATKTHSYTVFTRAGGRRSPSAGVDVKELASGKVTTVYCSERPRFYIYELKGLLACDPETAIGRACIK